MQYNVCRTCGAKDGMAGNLIDGECIPCYKNKETGNHMPNVTKADIIQAIRDEPELPGKLQPETIAEINKIGLERSLQILVRLTKDMIIDRIESLYEKGE